MSGKPHIAIIGAGLGGLAAAQLLQQAGHSVTVYEQASSFGRIGAGIHLGPNVVKVLSKAGIGDELLKTGVQPEEWFSRVWDTGENLFRLQLRGVSEERYGAPYLTVHRGDFHHLLTDVLEPGTIQYGKKLIDLKEDETSVHLSFEGGSSAKADIVIGADGLNSKVRDVLLGPVSPIFTGVVGHRVLFPSELLGDFSIPDFTKWWAPERHLIIYYITASRDEVYFVTGVPQAEWNTTASFVPCSKDELRAAFEGFHPEAQRIIELSPEDGITKWAFFERDPLPVWSSGRVVLLGDACHPMKPHMGQGAAMAIEDAAMLVRCIGETGTTDYRGAFELYEANRHDRTSLVQRTSHDNTWLRDETDPSWVFAYDVFSEPLVAPNRKAATENSARA